MLINSMAMEGDGCSLCARADKEVDRIAGKSCLFLLVVHYAATATDFIIW